MRRYYAIASLISAGMLFSCVQAGAQQDSLGLYEKIHRWSARKKFTRFIYRAVFVEPKTIDYPAKPTEYQGKILNPFLKYEGRRIRKVVMKVLDPFGFSVNDTSARPVTDPERAGNVLHINTRKWIIGNKLLFEENDSLDPVAVTESERLLREASFATDARIFAQPADSEGVILYVWVHDKWTITAPVEVTAEKANIRLRDQNLFGLGYEFEQYLGYTAQKGSSFDGHYSLNNIDNTYISARVAYETSQEGTGVGLAFDRPFYSPLAQWSGGLALSHNQRFYALTDPGDGITRSLNVTNGSMDLWGGRAFKILNGRKILKQSHNLVLGARYFHTTFFNRPGEAKALLGTNNNTSGVLGNIGFAVQQFYKDKYIYRFGANEDVPSGVFIQLVYGLQKKEWVRTRYYTGLEVARAAHFDIGYLSASFSYGLFFHSRYTNDHTVNLRLYHFTDLFRLGGWYFRHFTNYTFVHGAHKFYGQRLGLTGSDLYGIDGGGVRGSSRMILALESVAYAPYNIAGFHLAPVWMMGYGALGSPESPMLSSRVYQAYSLGLLFRNENLLNSTFQVSFGFYPYLPNGERNAFMYNPVTSFTVRVSPFAVGKPGFVDY